VQTGLTKVRFPMIRQPRDIGIGLALILVATLPTLPQAIRSPQNPPPATVPVDVVALGRDGRFADNLTPASLAVTVDGKPRQILWIRHVSRGPGALDDAGRRQTGGSSALRFAAEPERSVIIAVDELSIERGSERVVIQAAGALADRLGLDDRIGVVRIPIARDGHVALTTDRAEVRTALRQMAGQAVRPGLQDAGLPSLQPPPIVSDTNRVAGDPVSATSPERERPLPEADWRGPSSNEGVSPGARFMAGLEGVLHALQSQPGRKVIAVFSGGLRAGGAARLDELARAALAAHATVLAFGVPGIRDGQARAGLAALERLARSTGGSLTMVEQNADKIIARVIPELSACYVIGIELAASDADGRGHALRVEAPRQAITIRAPAWLVPTSDVDDMAPPAPATRPGQDVAEPGTSDTMAAEPPARDVEVQRLIDRASGYVAGYERDYSMLVAEEKFVQRTREEMQSLRSDLLLVRKPGSDGWVSFRDVFEVNGTAVRDREDRLKRLFLDPSVQAQAQLNQIVADSARYNIGQIKRNINVPLYPLTFLRVENLWRFRFRPAGRQDAGGVTASRIAYEETARPTLVALNKTNDLAARGWFLIDPASGAVIATRVEFGLNAGVLELEVRYARDDALGLWLPAEMTELHSVYGTRGPRDMIVSIDARATYSRFRRFQVSTDEQMKIPK
jgi:VWFA-related protein